MKTLDLTELNPAHLAALAKLASKGATKTRPELAPGKYDVDTLVTLHLKATVKVSEDELGVVTPQKAKPWALVHLLLEELNKMAEATESMGLNLKTLVEKAEQLDPDLAKDAQKRADAEMAELKEGTRSDRKGKVNVKGSAGVPVAS